ncbi:MAG: type I restriction enzyme HsdR N-terminal domain-containing protein [Bacteroidales bacterium]|nr:type I restriction enzyme HsdR N-terminal domain-containing protein [Bacteroidales bacterium]
MDLPTLNLPAVTSSIRTIDGCTEIFDPIRKVFVVLTPEEWVRQHFINYLVSDRLFPAGLIAIEKQIRVNRMSKRFDIVAHFPTGQPAMIVECKAPSVKISLETFNQALRYNLSLNIHYLALTNGLTHFCFRLNYNDKTSRQLDHIPSYQEIVG